MAGNPTVDIVLGTYNGERYLGQQIESILSQTYGDFRLLIRDDDSTDQTVKIARTYARDDSRITVIQDNRGNLGSCRNFSTLLNCSDADVIFFADQDDVWLTDKIEVFLNRYRGCDPTAPICLYSDLTVVNEDLHIVCPSLFRFRRLMPCTRNEIGRLVVQNVVTGCASMINKRLKSMALPIPDAAIMHDWWIALVAAAVGELIHIDKPTVLYRQHSRNVFGAPPYSIAANRNWGKMVLSLRNTMRQAEALAKLDGIGRAHGKVFETWASFADTPMLRRPQLLWRYKFLKYGGLRNLIFILLALSIRHRD